MCEEEGGEKEAITFGCRLARKDDGHAGARPRGGYIRKRASAFDLRKLIISS